MLTEKEHSHDWVVGCGSGIAGLHLASLDFFDSVFYQEKKECPAGEAKVELKNNISI